MYTYGLPILYLKARNLPRFSSLSSLQRQRIHLALFQGREYGPVAA